MAKHNPAYSKYILLADSPDWADDNASRFNIGWNTGWHPQFWMRWNSGYYHQQAHFPKAKALATANHVAFNALHWYQLLVTWDHASKLYRLYLNGVRIASINQFPEAGTPPEALYERAAEFLYLGNPTFAYSSASFGSTVSNDEQAAALYLTERTEADPEEERRLARIYLGQNLARWDWSPDATWQTALQCGLRDPADLRHFYVQGMESAPSITPEGLRIETAQTRQPFAFDLVPGQEDKNQVYLWTERAFEGDLHVTFEFKSLRPGGHGHATRGLYGRLPSTNGWRHEGCLLGRRPQLSLGVLSRGDRRHRCSRLHRPKSRSQRARL